MKIDQNGDIEVIETITLTSEEDVANEGGAE